LIIVDTSVLINLLRGGTTAAAERLIQIEREETPFHIPAICCQEVLQGAKDEQEWEFLYRNISTQRALAPEDPVQTHIAAARIFFECRRKGMTVRSTTDCIVAQLALENDADLLHDDEDFNRIARIRPLRIMR
jgi:predicted nucleic acid-binding protein